MHTSLYLVLALLSGTALSTPLFRSTSLEARDAKALKVEVEVIPSGSDDMIFSVPDISEIVQTLEIPGFGDATQPDPVEGIDELVEPGIAVSSVSAGMFSSAEVKRKTCACSFHCPVPTPIPSAAAAVIPVNGTLTPNITVPANTTISNGTTNVTHSLLPSISPAPPASLIPSTIPSSIAGALQDGLADLGNIPPSKVKRDPAPVAEAEPEADFLKDQIKAATTKAPISIPGLGNGVGGTTGACNTSNAQANQCSSGIPFCCSPDGNGGMYFIGDLGTYF
jgi:hypothetical protein